MKLFFMRHGEAEAANLLGSEEARTLTAEGKRQARLLAARLKKNGVYFEILWASPLKRAVETATVLVEDGLAQKVEVSNLLLPNTDPAVLAAFLTQLPDDPQVRGLVGHEPLLSETMEMLIFGARRGVFVLKKAGLGVLERESGRFWRLLALLSPTWL